MNPVESLAAAETNEWKTIESKSTDDTHKEWTITFSHDVDETSVKANDNVYVKNAKGDIVLIETVITGNEVIISSDMPYEVNESYTLYIESSIQSTSKKNLIKNTKFEFDVVEWEMPPGEYLLPIAGPNYDDGNWYKINKPIKFKGYLNPRINAEVADDEQLRLEFYIYGPDPDSSIHQHIGFGGIPLKWTTAKTGITEHFTSNAISQTVLTSGTLAELREQLQQGFVIEAEFSNPNYYYIDIFLSSDSGKVDYRNFIFRVSGNDDW